MPSSDYNKYLAMIKLANDHEDREMLRQIQYELIKKYGMDDDDAAYLIRQFRFYV